MQKNSPKVLLVTVRADLGGGPKHVDILLDKISYPVYVACPKDEPYYSIWKNHPKVEGVEVVPHRKLTPEALLRVAAFCRNKQIDIVHSHGKGAGIYSRLLKLLVPGLRVIHTYHGVSTTVTGLKRLLYYGVEKALYPLTDRFINVSYGERDYCVNAGILKPQRSAVIYNGIEPLERIAQPEGAKENTPSFVVATLSRFDHQKNMQETFAIAKHLREYRQIRFLWIGDGEDRVALEQAAQREGLTNITFAGFRQDIPKLLSEADVYLTTSRHEGLPFALIEAFSLKIPVVASDVVGNNEVVTHGVNGFLYPLGSIAEGAGSLLKLMEDQPTYQRFSADAYASFRLKYSATKMVREIENIYQMAI
ncbi:glycosyltransferase [Cesiribacter andamanensis]|uniref:Putative poly(Glycerol-phosphate) alpha-glucosyltransferase n=1 Tax=Cesiribacter andamanensis AMV16 TaxID=1279009 RepID=M7NMH4_9BACT|nr:glycosyltransferase [Cesiribacter andamanensis]EMR02980.1 putative poly(glycerol-phosphate) alpha-glucosyltransferase [Cesiribacter andamanensis AMV16]